MRTTIVCGLLGSGKTSFIKNTLAGSSEKTVVLVNDFGEAGIDGTVISDGGLETVELPSGCVCCTLRGELKQAVSSIISKFSPEHLVIEPSGVASASDVLEAIDGLPVGPLTVIAVVSAPDFTDLYSQDIYGKFFLNQIQSADIVLINKTDLATRGKLLATRGLIGTLNPRAATFETVEARVSAPLPQGAVDHQKPSGADSHFDFETFSFRAGRIDKSTASNLFNALSDGSLGHIVRAKALVMSSLGHRKIDLAYGNIKETPYDGELTGSTLVVIGKGINQLAISARFR